MEIRPVKKHFSAALIMPAVFLLLVLVSNSCPAMGQEITAGALASRHQDAVMQARYMEYDAFLERRCGDDSQSERITITGRVNIDGWSQTTSHIVTGGAEPAKLIIQYHLRNGIPVRLAAISHPAYPDNAHTAPLPEPVSLAAFRREAPLHPLYIFTSFIGSMLPMTRNTAKAPDRACDPYDTHVDEGETSGVISLCTDSKSGLVRFLEAELNQSGNCRLTAHASFNTLAGPPDIQPPDDVLAIFEKESAKTDPDEKKAEPIQGVCALPSAPARSVPYIASQGLPDSPITKLLVDRNGVVWAGSRKGVARFANNTWALLTAGGKLFGLSISDLLVRSDGALWVATSAGIYVLQNETWTLITTSQGLPDNNVTSLTESANGRAVWAGTMRGLGRWDKGAWQTIKMDRGLPSNDITALAVDTYGTLWVGTPKGVAIYSEGRFSSPGPDLPISGQFIKSLVAAPDGSVWAIAGALTGIVELRTDSWVHHTGRTGLPCAHVAHAAPGPNGCLWAACLDVYDNNVEILSYDGFTWSSLDLASGTQPYFVAPSADGSLWTATRDGILHLFFK
jgi:hypothetical protein